MNHKTLNKTSSLLLATCALCSFSIQAFDDLNSFDGGFLGASEKQGLQLFNQQLKSTATLAGSYERADIRAIGDNQYLIAAANKSNNGVDIFSYKQGQIKPLSSIAESEDTLESICLYRSEKDSAIYAFLLKSQQLVEQKLIYDLTTEQSKDLSIRQLPISHELSDCAVDDTSGLLYIAEQNVGVWQYRAETEAELARKLVLANQPLGKLDSELEMLQILADGSLLAAQGDGSNYLLQDGKASVIPATESVDIQTAAWNKQSLTLVSTEDSSLTSRSIKAMPLAQKQPQVFAQIAASAQTTPVARYGDAADDPAIWVNPEDPTQSLILGTDKQTGLALYDLNGQQRQFIATGRVNNVDIRNNFEYQGNKVALAAASQRDRNSIALYTLDTQSKRLQVQAEVATTLEDVYGLCMYQDTVGTYVFINDKDGRYQQYLITTHGNALSGELIREFKLIDQPEGCAADDTTGQLFVGVEDHGIYVTSAKANDKAELTSIATVKGSQAHPKLQDDIEGMALYQQGKNSYLVVSSQGNNSYAVFSSRAPYQYMGSFQVGLNAQTGIDGVSETDGLDVVSANLGGAYSQGLLVVQDGRNRMPEQPQNFKLVPFTDIAKQLSLALK